MVARSWRAARSSLTGGCRAGRRADHTDLTTEQGRGKLFPPAAVIGAMTPDLPTHVGREGYGEVLPGSTRSYDYRRIDPAVSRRASLHRVFARPALGHRLVSSRAPASHAASAVGVRRLPRSACIVNE